MRYMYLHLHGHVCHHAPPSSARGKDLVLSRALRSHLPSHEGHTHSTAAEQERLSRPRPSVNRLF